LTKDVYKRCICPNLAVHLRGHCPSDAATVAEDNCRNLHQDRFTDSHGVKDIALDESINAVLAVLHGHEPYPFQTLNYPCSSNARTHSDYIHFAAEPLPLMSAAWIALTDVDPRAGPVFYYEGSHMIPPYTMQDFGLRDRDQDDAGINYAKYQDMMHQHMIDAGYTRKDLVIKRGHVLLWSANLVHGGPTAEVEGLPRFSQMTHYFFRRAAYNWVPVASDITTGKVLYYDEAARDEKWGDRHHYEPFGHTRAQLSKFRVGTCRRPLNVKSPCECAHRIPKVLSTLFEHRAPQDGKDVIM